jgi:hypothetical protein
MAEATERPTLFEFTYDDTRINYSTSSITGEPRFTYSGPKGEHSFAGDEEIRTQETALGTEVTVTLESIPDLHTITLTIFIPDIAVEPGGEVEFNTFGIFTTTRTTIAGPPPGPAQTYEVIGLHGVASHVVF